MRITQAGVYVLIQKYGIEGLIVPDKVQSDSHAICSQIMYDVNSEQSSLYITENGKDSTVKVHLFDHISIEIKAEMIEFRRSINLHFRGCLNANSLSGKGIIKEKAEDNLDLNQAIKSKGKKSKGKH